jgi:hypothetical protein
MKRLATISWLLDRQIPWLPWWQELLLNWVSSWSTISTLQVVAANREEFFTWDLPTDLDHHRDQLEQLLDLDR